MNLYTALTRFSLGLPPRREDTAAIRQHLPELLSPNHAADVPTSMIPLVGPGWVHIDIEGFCARLNRWLGSYQEDDEGPRTSQIPLTESCPLRLSVCPKKSCELPPEDQPEKGKSNDAFEVFRFMNVGGGAGGDGEKRFLDLFRKTSKGYRGQGVKQLILTDPYLKTSFDEVGNDGNGFDLLCELMRALDLDENSELEVLVSQELGEIKLVANRLSKGFPNAVVKKLRVQGRIHDRFYLVRGFDGHLCGVFGPSLNGLKGQALFLMGDLTADVLKKLDNLLRT